MMQRMLRVACLALAFALAATPAFAQGGATSSISGVVQDASGGTIPGATVVAKNNATGAVSETTTTDNGTFTIPALNAGAYTVTVTLQGFKTFVANDVRVSAGSPASVKATLEVGGIAETVTVQAGAEIIQTQSSSVASTLTTNQIANLPLTSRNVIDFVTFLPGVQTAGSNRDSTVNGLPQSAINITVDGMNVQDNYLKTSDGFFARMSPRLDAVEEVTVTTAANGADSSGQGAVQIRFVTRSGSNNWNGSLYHTLRRDEFNATDWFDNRDGVGKPDLLQLQPGGRIGGPITIPGLFNGRDKAFFFVNYEMLYQPSDISLTRTTLHPNALNGTYRYLVGGNQVREVNVLQLAAANGQLATMDPTVQALLNDIRTQSLTTGTIVDNTDPLTQSYTFIQDGKSKNIYPTVRVDYNVTQNHRLTGSYNFQNINSNPDTTNSRQRSFPGFPLIGIQDSDRYTTSWSVRSTLGANMVNELRLGATGGATKFNPNVSISDWSGGDTGLANTNGFHLTLRNGLTSQFNSTAPSSREASTKVIENTLNYLKGNHSFSFGGSWTQVDLWLKNQTLVPTITFDVVTGDPALPMFSTANFPGASNAQLTAARQFYAMITGRAGEINGTARINEDTGNYEYLGLGTARGRMREMGFFVQDSWRMTPTFTVNMGLRYELQFPFFSLNNSYMTATLADLCGISGVNDPSNAEAACNLFQPGVTPGQKPTFQRFEKGKNAYDTDYNNWAPSLGFAWQLGERNGILGSLLGDEAVLRGGYALAYQRNGMSDFSDVFGANPGVSINANRTLNNGNLGTIPVLLRNPSTLGPPTFPLTATFPYTEIETEDVNIFHQGLQVPWADSWTVGLQRALTRNMAAEVRYVGTRSRDGWTTYNYNEVNWQDNGVYEEFLKAQANLAANIAAGRGNTFAYFGPNTGTSPLPITLAYFTGANASQAGNASAYTGSLWTNATFVNPLAKFNPLPSVYANALDAESVRRNNALNAGLPANFLVANPNLLGGADLTGNGGKRHYHSIQMELRRRLANGLQFDANYAYGKGYSSVRLGGFRRPRVMVESSGEEAGNVYHALKGNVVYDLPFGRGRRFGSNASGVMDRIIGGWQISATGRLQSGELMDFGNVRLVGMTKDDVQDMIKVRFDSAGRVWILPEDVLDNTVKAFNVSATAASGYSALGVPEGRYFAPANGPNCIEMFQGSTTDTLGAWGDCGVRSLVVQGPAYKNVDLAVVKRLPLWSKVNAEFRLEALNAFNFVNFDPFLPDDFNDWDTKDEFEITGLNGNNVARVIQFVARINF